MAMRGGKWGLLTKALIALCVELGVIFLIMPASSMQRVYFQDRQWVAGHLGEGMLKSIEAKSSGWFKRMIVDTGALRECYALCEREGKDRFDDRGLAKLFANRLDVFWVAVRLMFFRFGEIYIWWPCVLIMYLSLLVDSYLLREIRKNQSSHFSPSVYNFAKMSFAWLLTILILGPMVPYEIPPMVVPLVLGALGATMWGWVAYSPKRV